MCVCVCRYLAKSDIPLTAILTYDNMVILSIILRFHMHKWTYLYLGIADYRAFCHHFQFISLPHTAKHHTQRTQKWVYIRVYFFIDWIFAANFYSHDIDIVGHTKPFESIERIFILIYWMTSNLDQSIWCSLAPSLSLSLLFFYFFRKVI